MQICFDSDPHLKCEQLHLWWRQSSATINYDHSLFAKYSLANNHRRPYISIIPMKTNKRSSVMKVFISLLVFDTRIPTLCFFLLFHVEWHMGKLYMVVIINMAFICQDRYLFLCSVLVLNTLLHIYCFMFITEYDRFVSGVCIIPFNSGKLGYQSWLWTGN